MKRFIFFLTLLIPIFYNTIGQTTTEPTGVQDYEGYHLPFHFRYDDNRGSNDVWMTFDATNDSILIKHNRKLILSDFDGNVMVTVQNGAVVAKDSFGLKNSYISEFNTWNADSGYVVINGITLKIFAEQGTGGSGVTVEELQDIMGDMFSGNTEERITITYDDADGEIDVVVEDDLSQYDNTTSDFATNDYVDMMGGQSRIKQIAGYMVASNTETLINVVYQSADQTLDFVVEDNLSQYDNSTSKFQNDDDVSIMIGDTMAKYDTDGDGLIDQVDTGLSGSAGSQYNIQTADGSGGFLASTWSSIGSSFYLPVANGPSMSENGINLFSSTSYPVRVLGTDSFSIQVNGTDLFTFATSGVYVNDTLLQEYVESHASGVTLAGNMVGDINTNGNNFNVENGDTLNFFDSGGNKVFGFVIDEFGNLIIRYDDDNYSKFSSSLTTLESDELLLISNNNSIRIKPEATKGYYFRMQDSLIVIYDGINPIDTFSTKDYIRSTIEDTLNSRISPASTANYLTYFTSTGKIGSLPYTYYDNTYNGNIYSVRNETSNLAFDNYSSLTNIYNTDTSIFNIYTNISDYSGELQNVGIIIDARSSDMSPSRNLYRNIGIRVGMDRSYLSPSAINFANSQQHMILTGGYFSIEGEYNDSTTSTGTYSLAAAIFNDASTGTATSYAAIFNGDVQIIGDAIVQGYDVNQTYIAWAISDSTTELTTSNGADAPAVYACTIDSVLIIVSKAPTGSTLTFDILKNGSTIFSTTPTIDAGGISTADATTPYALSTTTLAWNDRLTGKVTSAGATYGGSGAIIVIYITKN